jgi:hypothetical protein
MLQKLQPYISHRNPRVRAKAAMCMYQSVSRLVCHPLWQCMSVWHAADSCHEEFLFIWIWMAFINFSLTATSSFHLLTWNFCGTLLVVMLNKLSGILSTNASPFFGLRTVQHVPGSGLLWCKTAYCDKCFSGSGWNQAVWNGVTHPTCSFAIEWQAPRSTRGCSKSFIEPVYSIPEMSWCPFNDRLRGCRVGMQATSSRPLGTVLPSEALTHYSTSCTPSHLHCYQVAHSIKSLKLLLQYGSILTGYKVLEKFFVSVQFLGRLAWLKQSGIVKSSM